MHDTRIAAARLAASWLLTYPDTSVLDRLDDIAEISAHLPADTRIPIEAFLSHLSGTPIMEVQQHYVLVFDMKRKACPYLSYWTHGDTRNRGRAILRFQQAYLDAGYRLGSDELPDHLAVVLAFAAVGDAITGEALLASHQQAIHLLRDALAGLGSAYVHVLDAVVATMPDLTNEIRVRMSELAASGPPAEAVQAEPFADLLPIKLGGARR